MNLEVNSSKDTKWIPGDTSSLCSPAVGNEIEPFSQKPYRKGKAMNTQKHINTVEVFQSKFLHPTSHWKEQPNTLNTSDTLLLGRWTNRLG